MRVQCRWRTYASRREWIGCKIDDPMSEGGSVEQARDIGEKAGEMLGRLLTHLHDRRLLDDTDLVRIVEGYAAPVEFLSE